MHKCECCNKVAKEVVFDKYYDMYLCFNCEAEMYKGECLAESGHP